MPPPGPGFYGPGFYPPPPVYAGWWWWRRPVVVAAPPVYIDNVPYHNVVQGSNGKQYGMQWTCNDISPMGNNARRTGAIAGIVLLVLSLLIFPVAEFAIFGTNYYNDWIAFLLLFTFFMIVAFHYLRESSRTEQRCFQQVELPTEKPSRARKPE
jgi:hypothetical protein